MIRYASKVTDRLLYLRHRRGACNDLFDLTPKTLLSICSMTCARGVLLARNTPTGPGAEVAEEYFSGQYTLQQANGWTGKRNDTDMYTKYTKLLRVNHLGPRPRIIIPNPNFLPGSSNFLNNISPLSGLFCMFVGRTYSCGELIGTDCS